MGRKLTHAGAIAVRTDGGPLRVLVVSAKRRPDRWIFPKGHIDSGEAPPVTALRELREEAGVDGELVGMVGRMNVKSGGKKGIGEYFLFRYLRDVPAEDDRRVRWLSVSEARALLSADDAKRLLDDAVTLLRTV